MEELIFTVTLCCPHRQYHSRSPHRSRGSLLAQSTACFWFCRTEPSLQDCTVHSPSVLVHTLHLLCFTPPFNGTPRKTESLSSAERIYWLHLFKSKYKWLCSQCPQVLNESQQSPTWWFNRKETALNMEIFENKKGSLLNTVNCYRNNYSSFLSIWG